MYNTGALPGEVVNLRIKDFDNHKNTVTYIRDTSTRTIELEIETSNIIDQYLSMKDEYSPDSFIFESKRDNPLSHRTLFNILKKRTKEAKIKQNISSMMFRFTFADRKMKEGMDIRELQQLLGHSHTYLTQRFMFILPDKTK